MNWEIIVSISSTFIALSALVFSVISFKKQQDRADAHAKTAVKPLLSIRSQNKFDLKSIRLTNFGVGPAVIKKADFRRTTDNEPTNEIADLFNLNTTFDSFVNIPEKRAIPAEGEIMLIKLSLKYLVDKGFSKENGLAILRDWKNQKTGILVHIEYSDIYGNEMESLDEKLN